MVAARDQDTTAGHGQTKSSAYSGEIDNWLLMLENSRLWASKVTILSGTNSWWNHKSKRQTVQMHQALSLNQTA